IFGAEQFKTSIFLYEQGTKSPPYCRMARFLTQFRRKYAVLNHMGFDSPHLNHIHLLITIDNIEARYSGGHLSPAPTRYHKKL
ncbi:MAG: hypothetical protein ACI4SX_01900, partial [Candidatus Fimenecus sp.]